MPEHRDRVSHPTLAPQRRLIAPTETARLEHLWLEWQSSASNSLPGEPHLNYGRSDHQPFLYGMGLYADPRPGRASVFHYGHEQGFSAAAHLTQSGLRVICLSNHAGIPADHIAAAAITEHSRDHEADPEEILTRSVLGRQPDLHAPVNSPNSDEPDALPVTYVCDEVPGTVRLSGSARSLWLWRRGTRDRLDPIDSTTYSGHGYTLVFPVPATDDGHLPDSFVLDLDRAPDLHYIRRPL